MIRIVVKMATPSLNTMLRAHRYARTREQNEWAAAIWSHIIQHRPPLATGKRLVTVTRFGKKRLDAADNGPAGCKYLMDALVKHKLLIDDDDKNVETVFSQEPLMPNCAPHTVITLIDL